MSSSAVAHAKHEGLRPVRRTSIANEVVKRVRFLNTNSFESAILKAANLGDEADTTAAVCGQVAGAYYAVSGIPKRWLDRLALLQEITDLADGLHAAVELRSAKDATDV